MLLSAGMLLVVRLLIGSVARRAGRVDNVFGDRHLITTAPNVEHAALEERVA